MDFVPDVVIKAPALLFFMAEMRIPAVYIALWWPIMRSTDAAGGVMLTARADGREPRRSKARMLPWSS